MNPQSEMSYQICFTQEDEKKTITSSILHPLLLLCGNDANWSDKSPPVAPGKRGRAGNEGLKAINGNKEDLSQVLVTKTIGRVHLIKSLEALLHEDVIIHTHQLLTRRAVVAAA